jgi:hypothetical protein
MFVMIHGRGMMETIEFKRYLCVVLFTSKLEILKVFMSELVRWYPLNGIDFREFPINDTNIMLISKQEIEAFKLFGWEFPHPFFDWYIDISPLDNLFSNNKIDGINNFMQMILEFSLMKYNIFKI